MSTAPRVIEPETEPSGAERLAGEITELCRYVYATEYHLLTRIPSIENQQRRTDNSILDKDIDSESCAARWHAGERMDWQMAVSAMFPR